MKTIEKEIDWQIIEDLENPFNCLACGKAIVVIPKDFKVPQDEYDYYRDGFFGLLYFKDKDCLVPNEKLLLDYLGRKWSSIIRINYKDDTNSLINIININDNALGNLNEDAKSLNIGTIKNWTVKFVKNSDEKIETIKIKDKTYKITTEIKTVYNLVQDEPENEIKESLNPTESEQ